MSAPSHPTRLADLIWPNFYGDRFTGNRSWFEFLPPRDRHARLDPRTVVEQREGFGARREEHQAAAGRQ